MRFLSSQPTQGLGGADVALSVVQLPHKIHLKAVASNKKYPRNYLKSL